MKNYYIYTTMTGVITRKGQCLDIDFDRIWHNAGDQVVEGYITDENMVVDGVPIHIPPPPKTAQELAEIEEQRFIGEATLKIAKAFFNHENRLRVLEGKPAVTWEQFKAAIRGMA
jgi:hypothetical protein